MAKNTLYYGDNLEVLRHYIPDESVDLVYLDPPFKSDQDYNVLFQEHGIRSAAQIKAFEDSWQWDQAAALAFQEVVEQGGSVSLAMQAFRTFLGESDMLAYLSMMAPRLLEMHRVLKPSGSIYLHCDPTASHYLKMLLDSIFGPKNFRNEIIWKRTSAHSSAKRYGPVHDVILFYTRSDKYKWNAQFQPHDEAYLASHYRSQDAQGRRYRLSDLTAAGVRKGSSGEPWRGFDPNSKGNHWKYSIPNLEKLNKEGRIFWSKKEGAWPSYIRYLDEVKGTTLQDIWNDIPPINAMAKERLGYPTQKPETLLERIISAGSNEGDSILDPFCGCGTAIAAAQKLHREWFGIDITHLAITLIKHRLQHSFGSEITYKVIGEPIDVEGAKTLAAQDPFQFQWWALGLVGARPFEQKKGADKGIDGRLYFHDEAGGKTKQIIFSVKAGSVSVPHVRDLRGVIEREAAAIGILISLNNPTKPMRTEAASAGFYESPWGTKHPRLQILTIKDLLSGKTIDFPPSQANVTFKKAQRAKSSQPKNEKLPFD